MVKKNKNNPSIKTSAEQFGPELTAEGLSRSPQDKEWW